MSVDKIVENSIVEYPAWRNAKKTESVASDHKFLDQINSVTKRKGMTQDSYKIYKTGIKTDNMPYSVGMCNIAGTSDTSSVDAYRKYLELKYGKVTIKDVPKDQKTLEKLGKSMSGNDVVIAPNILEQMANDPEKAAYYEQKIDYFFDTIIPRETARWASMGLVFEPAGVVVHKDGTATYICGCSDSPERVAQVNAINKAKREKRATQREAAFERSREEAIRRAQQIELSDRRRSMAEALAGYGAYGQETADMDVFYVALGIGL
ncbi:MAG: hypothetical protein HDR04_03085 [Lachnospiraceae bacterium]|nr:hypothetical protein [Lachnospiraceae bacterium]